jgi:hypothetical protein
MRIFAAWLWSKRTATIVGAAAAALHGAKSIPHNVPVELIHTNPRAPRGVLTRRAVLLDGETQTTRATGFYLRLLLFDAGLPRPQTQIPVAPASGRCPQGMDGIPVAYLGLGWQEYLVAVEYDGDYHRTDRRQYVKDIRRLEMLEGMGWIIVRVVAEDHPADIVRRVRAALATRCSSAR